MTTPDSTTPPMNFPAVEAEADFLGSRYWPTTSQVARERGSILGSTPQIDLAQARVDHLRDKFNLEAMRAATYDHPLPVSKVAPQPHKHQVTLDRLRKFLATTTEQLTSTLEKQGSLHNERRRNQSEIESYIEQIGALARSILVLEADK